MKSLSKKGETNTLKNKLGQFEAAQECHSHEGLRVQQQGSGHEGTWLIKEITSPSNPAECISCIPRLSSRGPGPATGAVCAWRDICLKSAWWAGDSSPAVRLQGWRQRAASRLGVHGKSAGGEAIRGA